jgi:hypothetical protein
MALSSSSSSSSPKSLLPSEPEPWRTNPRPRLPPGHLLDIPDGPIYDILTMYLRIEDVRGLDSALCNKRRRAEFLELVSRRVLLFNREDVLSYSFTSQVHRRLGAGALRWILTRGIHLASLDPFSRANAAKQQSIRESVRSFAFNGLLDKLESIYLSDCTYMKDADLAIILLKCYGSIKSIDIRGCGVTESSAPYIKRCTKLEAFAPKGNESAAEMIQIFQACPKLRKANLSVFRIRLTDEVLYSMAAHCLLIEHLDIARCTTVSDPAIQRIAESCPLLQWINVGYCNITDASVISLCTHCPLLTRVYLANCDNLTDAAVLAVAEKLPGLAHVALGGTDAITSSAVEILATKCQELEFIGINTGNLNITDDILKKIAEQCSKLEKLSVYGCTEITAIGLAILATRCSRLKNASFYDCNKISAESVAYLMSLFPLVNWISNAV